jgi:hypothetical protein
VAAAVEAEVSARIEKAGFGLHVHDAPGAIAVLGRQRTGNDLDRLGEARIKRLAKD